MFIITIFNCVGWGVFVTRLFAMNCEISSLAECEFLFSWISLNSIFTKIKRDTESILKLTIDSKEDLIYPEWLKNWPKNS